MRDQDIWQEIESKRGTGSDKAKAREILEAFDRYNFIRQYDIQAETRRILALELDLGFEKQTQSKI